MEKWLRWRRRKGRGKTSTGLMNGGFVGQVDAGDLLLPVEYMIRGLGVVEYTH